jgi:hypothetical protein
MSQPTSPLHLENIQGQWWLPGAPDVRRSGSLSVVDGGVRVHLHGRLAGDGLPGLAGLTPVLQVVHGHLETGKHVTLRSAVIIKDTQTLIGEGGDHSEISASEALIGAHVDDPHRAKFGAFSLTIPGLLRWAAVTGITESMEMEGEELRREYSYTRPADRICVLADGGRITLRACSTLGSGQGDTRVAISEWGILIVEPAETVDLSTFRRDYGMPLTRLLTFAHDQPVEATQLAVRSEPGGDAAWIEVVTGREYQRELKERAGQDYVVSGRTDESFQGLIQKWLGLHERFRIPLDVHFAHAYEAGVVLERGLTESMQALEGLDRISNPVSDEVIEEHEADLARMRELLPDEPKRIRQLVGRLKYAYEPNLAHRLQRQLEAEQGALPLEKKERNLVAENIARTRNLLTHLDSERERPTIQEMYDASASVTTLTKLIVLSELNVPPKERGRICVNRDWHTPSKNVPFVG